MVPESVERGGMMSMSSRDSEAVVTGVAEEGICVGMDGDVGNIGVTGDGQEAESEGKVDASEDGVTEKGKSDSINRTCREV